MELWDTTVESVKRAVEVVKEVVSKLWDAIVKMAAQMFSKVIQPMISALSTYLNNIGSGLKAIYEDYRVGRAPSVKHMEALIRAILPPIVMNFIMGMSIIYTVINIIVTFGVPGIGTIVSLAIGAAIGAAITQYGIPHLDFLKGLWESARETLANGFKSLLNVLHNLGLSSIDIAAEIVNTIAFGAGVVLTVMKKAVYGAKTICGIVFGVLSILAGLDQRDIWMGVAGLLMGFVSLILGVWSTMDIVETTLDAVLFVVNIIGGMNGLMLSAVGLIA